MDGDLVRLVLGPDVVGIGREDPEAEVLENGQHIAQHVSPLLIEHLEPVGERLEGIEIVQHDLSPAGQPQRLE